MFDIAAVGDFKIAMQPADLGQLLDSCDRHSRNKNDAADAEAICAPAPGNEVPLG